ncbi:hypothetical protein PZA11_002133 [Diplocarpon coronariae]
MSSPSCLSVAEGRRGRISGISVVGCGYRVRVRRWTSTHLLIYLSTVSLQGPGKVSSSKRKTHLTILGAYSYPYPYSRTKVKHQKNENLTAFQDSRRRNCNGISPGGWRNFSSTSGYTCCLRRDPREGESLATILPEKTTCGSGRPA